jgi:choline-glycine betaine transporter
VEGSSPKVSIMHWTAVLLAAYAAGVLEFWRVCETAPIAQDDIPDVAARG